MASLGPNELKQGWQNSVMVSIGNNELNLIMSDLDPFVFPLAEDRLNLVTNDLDPFDISLKMDLRDGSTRQSHNSPASSRSASTMMVQWGIYFSAYIKWLVNHNRACHPGDHIRDYYHVALSFKSGHCNSFENQAPIELIYRYLGGVSKTLMSS